MRTEENNLIWIDLEMTGLEPQRDRIIEIATIVTDSELNILAEGPVCAIYQEEEVLAAMDSWNQTHHRESGLVDRVRCSQTSVEQAEQATLTFLQKYVAAGISPMCGNTICQDRRFLARWMPELEQYFHYRHLDVSTLKELARRWYPDVFNDLKKGNAHQALADIRESIEELRYYRQHILI